MVFICIFFAVLPVYGKGELVQVSEHVYSYLDRDASVTNSYGANAGIVIGAKGVAVIDTLISAKQAERFMQDIRAVTDKPVLYAVNTHWHLDHSFGNGFFKDQGAVIISHEASDVSLREKGPAVLADIEQNGLTPQDMAGTRVEYADIVFEKKMKLDLGDITVELLYVFPSHTQGSTLVNIPNDKVVFAGDILFTDFHPYMVDGEMKEWNRTLDFLAGIGADKIVPGHGPLSSKRDVLEMKTYVTKFDSLAGEMSSYRYTIEQIEAELKKVLPKRSRGEWMIGVNLKGKYYQRATD
jgi:glyoxylase-like metal-dependent hydrolase (beta-lactamase superfamily II)